MPAKSSRLYLEVALRQKKKNYNLQNRRNRLSFYIFT